MPNLPMEVKGLLEKIRQKENQFIEYYFALEIGREFIKSAIFSIEENQIKIVSFGDKERWESEEEIIEAVDASLSSATEKLPIRGEVQEPSKVIFGLFSDWIKEDKIVDDKLRLLKKLSDKLDLKPTGFVTITEAIVYYLKTKEGIPPTAILIEVGLKKIGVSLVKIGKISDSELVDKSGDFVSDLIEGLSRFETKEPLPARILIYDSDEQLEDARQQLITHPWVEEKREGIEFLHLPKVEVLPSNFDISAIAWAGGREIARTIGLYLDDKITETKEETELTEEVEKRLEKDNFVVAEELGFIKEKDISEKDVEFESPEAEKPEFLSISASADAREKLNIFSFFLLTIKKINFNFLRGFISNFRRLPFIFIFIAGVFLILGGGLFAAYWYIPKAEITLFLQSKILEKDFTLKLDPQRESLDKENFILPSRELKIEVKGSRDRATTGSKEIGDPARGEVTIYNGTSSEKVFKSGTIITSPAGLEFTLDDEVKVASQSSAADPPGKAKIKVTAVKIGAEGNLAAGTEFTIANYVKSDFVAKNESAFSGGSSRQIQAVSEDDQKELFSNLKNDLENQAKTEIISQLSSGQKIIEESISSEVIEKNFSHKIGEVTDNLRLDLKIRARVLVYVENELRQLVEEKILESISEDFEYKPEETDFSFNLGKINNDGSVSFKAHLKAKLIPKMNLEEIRNNLAGKYLIIGRTYLDNLPNVTGFYAKITPQFPGRLNTFPRRPNRIEIKTEIQ